MNARLTQIIFALIALACLAGCDEHVDYKDEGLNFDVDKDLKTALEHNKMPQLAVRLHCTACHELERKIVGPSWKQVGSRYQNSATFEYQGKTYPLVEGLVEKISHGGAGHWGTREMPAIDPSGAKHEQIEKLVRFILEAGKR
ncbi:MAG TPA: c-type cytochrome [Gallionellaceae bacterium]